MPDRHYLTPLFESASVAVIGASIKPDAVGAIVLGNIIAAGFAGDVRHAGAGRHPEYRRYTAK